MDPTHVQALVSVKIDEQARLEQLERYFAVRAEARLQRRRRAQRLQTRLFGWRSPRSVTQRATRPAL